MDDASRSIMFDDFAYADSADPLLAQRDWTVRTGIGGPWAQGATWSVSAVTFPITAGRRALQLESNTDGSSTGTVQAEVFHQRKFHEGTFRARILFADASVPGMACDQLVQAFFTITPLAFDMDPDYGELDVEYLPNGGWGESTASALHATSWETYRRDPWLAVNTHTVARSSYAGWHDVVINVADHRIRYYVDGWLVADHGEPYYPETPMSIRVNQ